MPPEAPHEIAALLDRYERPLVRYALSILGDLEAARDVVQETFIKYVQRRASSVEGAEPAAEVESRNGSASRPSSLDPRPPHAPRPSTLDLRPPEAWLFTVCRNRAIDHQRKHRRLIPMNPLEHDRRSEEPGPAALLESREMAGSLFRLLDELSENQSEVIRLKFQNDLSYKEIAEVTQLSVTNVGFLLHTGLKKLRALVLERPQDDFPLPIRHAL